MPLHMMTPGSRNLIRKITGKLETKQFLEKLGFVPGEFVTVVSENCGNLIVNIKDSRVAISRDMALRIVV
jgi:ferrous iron transport protein A